MGYQSRALKMALMSKIVSQSEHKKLIPFHVSRKLLSVFQEHLSTKFHFYLVLVFRNTLLRSILHAFQYDRK